MANQRKSSDRSQNEDLAVEQLFRSNVANIVPVELEKEMRSSFIDYAMSVITERALPDVRDGLKPVHRRILYSMLTQGFTPDKPYRKCATTVGDVLGRFHPHGDAAVYDTMVRLAQDFSMRYPLVDGHGNFGSRDGDPPAAYRYTEARLERLAVEMMSDINKDTVDFQPNFDEHEMEPTVLPAHFPNLLVSGSIGIAVGMSTNIPPHNLGETIDASIMLLKNPEATLEDLMTCLPGPDFPTGGTILGTSGIRSAYATGRGRIVVRATAEIEELTDGSFRILVSDLPYMVNKAKLIRNIAEQHKDKKLDGIAYVRDESDRNEPVRIVIGLKRSANANVVLNQLFRKTSLQESFSANMLALVPDGGQLVPRVLNLKDALSYFNDHQKEVITRRTKFDLERTEQRKHIVEGLRIAIDNINEVIRIIRSSATEKEAKAALSERFGFSDRQSQHIVDMRLGRLTHLERDKLEKEYNDLLERIAYFVSILSDEQKLIEVIVEEMLALRNRFNDERRTEIDPYAEDISDESLIPEKQVVITMTNIGYVKRMAVSTYSMQHRGGRGISGLNMREDDMIKQIVTASTHDWLLFFTNTGRVFRLKGYRIPEESRQARGLPIVNLLRLNPGESVQTIIPLDADHEEGHLLFATQNGLVKRTAISEFKNINRAGLIAISLREDDSLVSVEFTRGNDEVILVTEQGYSIRFSETDCRAQGRDTIGVKGISLSPKDKVISLVKVAASPGTVSEEMIREVAGQDMQVAGVDKTSLADTADNDMTDGEAVSLGMPTESILFVSAKGFGKRTAFSEFRVQNRGGKGLIAYKPNKKTGVLIAALSVHCDEDVLLINDKGLIIRITAAEISQLGRMAMGVKLMRFRGSEIVDVAIVPHEEHQSSADAETVTDVDTLEEPDADLHGLDSSNPVLNTGLAEDIPTLDSLHQEEPEDS